MKRLMIRGVGICAVLAAGIAQGQQQEAPPPTVIRVTSRIVVLDVNVYNRKTHEPVTGLTREDFTVTEDETVQAIRTFEGPEAHVMPLTAQGAPVVVHDAGDLKKIGGAPVAVIVLDELNTRFEDSSFARQMLVKYLEKQPAVLKLPTVLMAAQTSGFAQLHDYTQDRDALIGIVKKRVPQYPWRQDGVERMTMTIAALQQIAQASSGTPGKKELIWVGNGFPTANTIGMFPPDAEKIEAAVRKCVAKLLAARVTVYTINPMADSGVTIQANDIDDLSSGGTAGGADPFGVGTVNFSSLGPSTGGAAFQGRNDLNNVIATSIDRGQIYYTLSYSPTNKSDDATVFRKIKIVMKDKNLVAVTRDGYFAVNDAQLNATTDETMDAKQKRANLQLELSNALLTVISYNGLDVTATKSAEGEWTLHVAEKGIAWSGPDAQGAQHEEATVAAGWYDAKGKLVGHLFREQVAMRGAGNGGATFKLPVMLTGQPVRIRFVVRDALNGKLGTVDVKGF